LQAIPPAGCVVWTLYSDLVGWQRPVDNEPDRVGPQSGRGYPKMNALTEALALAFLAACFFGVAVIMAVRIKGVMRESSQNPTLRAVA